MNLRFKETVPLAAAVETALFEQILDNIALRMFVEISNDGNTNAFTAFTVQLQDHPNGEFYAVLSGGDFATPTDLLRWSSANSPASLTHGNKAHLHLNIEGAYAIKFTATSASGTTATILGSSSILQRN